MTNKCIAVTNRVRRSILADEIRRWGTAAIEAMANTSVRSETGGFILRTTARQIREKIRSGAAG